MVMYANFASVYDRLMREVPYAEWVRFLTELFKKHGIEAGDILDLGCGTGNVTIPLAEMGYQVTGLDMSADMLAVAEEKARSRGLDVRWIQQDMREANLGELRFDLVISMTDSLNYLQTGEELKRVFVRTAGMLRDNGWLIFDLNSLYKISCVFGNNVFTYLEDDVAYIWENRYDDASRTCYMDLTFFVREKDGRYIRFSENHHETGYPVGEIRDLLAEAGFHLVACYREGSFEGPGETTERIYFAARKTDRGRGEHIRW